MYSKIEDEYGKEIAQFRKFANKTAKSYAACFGWIFEGGGIEHRTGGCHGGLYTAPRSQGTIKYVINSHQLKHKELTDAEHKIFINYLVNESPYKDVHLRKDPDAILEDYYLLDASAPNNLVGAAATTARGNTESFQNYFSKMFTFLRGEMGMKPNDAYVFANIFRGDLKKIFPMYAGAGVGNVALAVEYGNREYLKNFLNATPAIKLAPYNETYSFDKTQATWGTRGSNHGEVYNYLVNLKPRVTTQSTNFNIFDILRKKLAGIEIHNKKDLQSIIDQWYEWVEPAKTVSSPIFKSSKRAA